MWALGDYPSVASELIREFGPIVIGAAGIGPGLRILDGAMADLGDRFGARTGSMDWEYLLVVARRR
jgi:hypothetical protein